MIKYIITIILILLLYYFITKNINEPEKFNNEISKLDDPTYVHLYDDKGNKINVVLISKPFSSDKDYRQYMINMNKYIFLGISSYMEFPHMPTNPLDNYKIEQMQTNPYYLDMYFSICQGWLHCFKEPIKYIPMDKPNVLISESDIVNYKNLVPDNTPKEYDFIYSCPKVNKDSGCDDWVSYNKNWELAQKCLPILCEKYKLKGLLIGREGCDLPENSKQYLTTTGWVDYGDMIGLYKKCKFLFVPNVRDASPRVITEAMSLGLSCLMNKNILGGWKYINDKTGEFFNDENDIDMAIDKLLKNMPNHNPRQYIIDNYGPINTGKRLKEFIFEHFKDKLNITDTEYISIRYPITNY
jgi:hypothetical protein